MSPAWTAHWLVALRRRRLLALNAGIPLLLVTPVALSGAPAAHAAAVYTVLFVFFGVFGSSIPLVRDGSSGLLARWRLAGLPPRRWLGPRVLAQATIDLLEALPSLAVICWAHAASPEATSVLVGALALTLLVANSVGTVAAALARSLGEAALFSSVLALLLVHAAGAFRVPSPGSLAERAEALVPFRVLHEGVLHIAGGPPPAAAAWGPAAATGLVLFGAIVLAAPSITARLTG